MGSVISDRLPYKRTRYLSDTIWKFVTKLTGNQFTIRRDYGRTEALERDRGFQIICLQSFASALRMDLFANIKGIKKGLSAQTGHPLRFIMLVLVFFTHAIVRVISFIDSAQLLIFSYAFQTLLSYPVDTYLRNQTGKLARLFHSRSIVFSSSLSVFLLFSFPRYLRELTSRRRAFTNKIERGGTSLRLTIGVSKRFPFIAYNHHVSFVTMEFLSESGNRCVILPRENVHTNCAICKSSRNGEHELARASGDDEPTIRSTAALLGHMASIERVPPSPPLSSPRLTSPLASSCATEALTCEYIW